MVENVEQWMKKIKKSWNKKGRYRIEYWQTEADRNQGNGETYSYGEKSIKKAIELGRQIYYKNNVACVEVVDNKTGFGVWNINNKTIKKFPDGEYLK